MFYYMVVVWSTEIKTGLNLRTLNLISPRLYQVIWK